MKRKSTSEKRKNELTDLNIGRRMIINNVKYEPFVLDWNVQTVNRLYSLKNNNAKK